MTAIVLRGDARALPLPDASVDLLVTSPPYFALRAYQDGGKTYESQIGSEPTPQEYIAALLECTREWVRVLKPSGSIFVNLGDKYNSAAGGQNMKGADERGVPGNSRGAGYEYRGSQRGRAVAGPPPKSLMLLPERYRIGCVDQLGLIARAVVVWSKPNGLPESVQDRVRRSHEDWVHLVRQPRYYAAVDEIREATQGRPGFTWTERKGRTDSRAKYSEQNGHGGSGGMADNPLGKLPGSVWTIATEPLTVPAELGVDHFAAFPTEWPRRIIQGWSPSGICTACGEGRRPVVDKRLNVTGTAKMTRAGRIDLLDSSHTRDNGYQGPIKTYGQNEVTITGEVCACPEPTAPTRPALVVDPFGGTGTVALVARALGRHAISVDRSADYCRLAQWRTADPGQLAKVLGVPKPPPQVEGQAGLFEVAS